MTPTLYGHPFSSYTWKALIGLHEAQVAFDFRRLGPDQPDAGARLAELWPPGRQGEPQGRRRGSRCCTADRFTPAPPESAP